MISIITVTFNAASTLKETLDSIVAQTFNDYEIVAVDGGSTDGTVEIFKQYSRHIGTLISEPDKGVYDAMNKGVRHAKGDILFFLNAQDTLYAPDVLEKVNSMFYAPDKPYIVFGNIFFSNKSNIPAEQLSIPCGVTRDYQNNGFNDPGICHQCIFYRKELFDILGGYDLSYKIYADFDFNIRAFTFAYNRYRHIPITIAAFDLGGISTRTDPAIVHQQHLENMTLRKKLEDERTRAERKRFLFSRGREVCEGGYFIQVLGVRLDWTALKRRLTLLPQSFPFFYSMRDGYPQDFRLSGFEAPVNGVSWSSNPAPSITFVRRQEKLPNKLKIFSKVAVNFPTKMEDVEVVMFLNKKEIDSKLFSTICQAEFRDQVLFGEVDGTDLPSGENRISFLLRSKSETADLKQIHLGIQEFGTAFADRPVEVPFGKKLLFQPNHAGAKTLFKRYYPPEDWGTWLLPGALLRFKLPDIEKEQDILLKFTFNTLFSEKARTREIQLLLDGKMIGTDSISDGECLPAERTFRIPYSSLPKDGVLELTLQADAYVVPCKDFPNNRDVRHLGLGVESLTVLQAPTE